jgi:cytochrome c-type biogenesis protein CcmH
MLTRRDFFTRAAASSALVALTSRANAQNVTQSFSGPMSEDAHRPVSLPPKSSTASMSDEQRDDLEHHIKCQCGCPLDVFTCRTTDFACTVSPAMHRDVMSLVSGGYSGQEIIAAFQKVYGERVLMQPTKVGFNWLGYVLPFIAIGTGGIVLLQYLRNRAAAHVPVPVQFSSVDASPEELARLRDAIHDDS